MSGNEDAKRRAEALARANQALKSNPQDPYQKKEAQRAQYEQTKKQLNDKKNK